jgi:hypothetical protein
MRIDWADMPAPVRRGIDEMLGSPVLSTLQTSGGFSPGPAVRAKLADGRVVFVKAVGTELNPDSPRFHRREATVLRSLPATVPAPRLLGVFDDGEWIALGIEWLEGRNPVATDADDVRRLLALFDRLAAKTKGLTIEGIGAFADVHHALHGHWRRLAEEPLPGLDAWSLRHLDRLAELGDLAPEASAGDHLVHVDGRTDNVLLETTRGDVFVDWPAAAFGAPWIDLVGSLPALHLDGGPPPEEVFASSALSRAAEREAVDAVLVDLAGFFTRQSLLPPPPGLPTVRAFQAAQGVIARAWAADRLGLR